MVLARLLEFTDPEGVHNATAADDGDRGRWALLLDGLVGFPLAEAPDGSGPVFAEAETDDPLRQPPVNSNANYPITHLAAVFPAGVVTTSDRSDDDDDGEALAAIGRRTAALMNEETRFAPGNGFVLSWPPAALLAKDGASAGQLLRSFSAAYARTASPNGWPDLGGGGLEQIGAMEAIHALMLRVDRGGVLSVFPAWPKGGTPVSFTRLRSVGVGSSI
jgi:hypothetical protein